MSIVIPGQFLGPSSKYQPGSGTHLHNGNLYASVVGTVVTIEATSKQGGPQKRLNRITVPEPQMLPTISVRRSLDKSKSRLPEKREVLPEVGKTVLCRVMRITPRQAVVAILVVNDSVLDGEWQGVIRSQDVRATEKDKVKIYDSFRPGDIVRAQVVSVARVVSIYFSVFLDLGNMCVG